MPGYELIGEEEKSALSEVMDGGGIFFRYGFDSERKSVYKVKEFEEKFAQYIGVKYAQAVSSGTAALRVALAALGIGPGDEVITTCFTFVATVEAILESGAVPVIAEIDETLNIDPYDLENKITDKTKVIIPVHMLGVPARMREITEIARRYNLSVIEDSAQACGSSYYEKKVGALGDINCFSFDYFKTLTTGEGGMIATNNRDLYLRSSYYHDHGHEHNPNVPRGEDSKNMSGFNYRMNELQGALGLVQLSKLDYILSQQRANKKKIKEGIKNISKIRFRVQPYQEGDGGDTLVIFLPTVEQARRFANLLTEDKISLKILPSALGWHFFVYWPHIFKRIEQYKSYSGDISEVFSKSYDILHRSIAIPVLVKMDENTIGRIVQSLQRAAKSVL